MPLTTLADRRRAELAKIHIGAKQLCDDKEAYRDMLEAVAGKRSAAELDGAGRRKVLAHMRACGARFGSSPERRKRAAPEIAPLLRKIDALLIDAGSLPRSYAENILRRMTKHSHRTPLEWARPDQLHDVVAALEYDKRRRAGRAAKKGEG